MSAPSGTGSRIAGLLTSSTVLGPALLSSYSRWAAWAESSAITSWSRARSPASSSTCRSRSATRRNAEALAASQQERRGLEGDGEDFSTFTESFHSGRPTSAPRDAGLAIGGSVSLPCSRTLSNPGSLSWAPVCWAWRSWASSTQNSPSLIVCSCRAAKHTVPMDPWEPLSRSRVCKDTSGGSRTCTMNTAGSSGRMCRISWLASRTNADSPRTLSRSACLGGAPPNDDPSRLQLEHTAPCGEAARCAERRAAARTTPSPFMAA
mmetsp:Transcript_55062/g.126449  ORF Transcript_55062/g.126449 Transcript_55062/m.126449 type:complete len:264 (-) Transcript_55062:9-800(-)